MVRISRTFGGELEFDSVGGRGAWLCLRDDAEHRAAIASGVARGLRGHIDEAEFGRIDGVIRERRMKSAQRGG